MACVQAPLGPTGRPRTPPSKQRTGRAGRHLRPREPDDYECRHRLRKKPASRDKTCRVSYVLLWKGRQVSFKLLLKAATSKHKANRRVRARDGIYKDVRKRSVRIEGAPLMSGGCKMCQVLNLGDEAKVSALEWLTIRASH